MGSDEVPEGAVFDETIHAPLRLRVCGMLRPVERLDFAVVREALAVSDASLSKHLKVLHEAGFVTMSKEPSPHRTDARRVTWLTLTARGRRAFDGHVQALREIAAGVGGPP